MCSLIPFLLTQFTLHQDGPLSLLPNPLLQDSLLTQFTLHRDGLRSFFPNRLLQDICSLTRLVKGTTHTVWDSTKVCSVCVCVCVCVHVRVHAWVCTCVCVHTCKRDVIRMASCIPCGCGSRPQLITFGMEVVFSHFAGQHPTFQPLVMFVRYTLDCLAL